jgi:hypothetical protein
MADSDSVGKISIGQGKAHGYHILFGFLTAQLDYVHRPWFFYLHRFLFSRFKHGRLSIIP